MAVAVTLGIICGVLVVGIMQGWVRQRLHDAIFNEVSHIQIHNSEYLRNEEADLTVRDTAGIAEAIKAMPGVRGWTQRTRMTAMISTPWANSGVDIYGINPSSETSVTEIYKQIVMGAGVYLRKSESGSILISDKTAEILKLKQYCLTGKVMNNLGGSKIPEDILKKIGIIRDERFRSPKEFLDTLKAVLSSKELERYSRIIMDSSLDYKIRNKVQITISDNNGTPVQGTFRICGIYKTSNSGFDQASVFVSSGDLAALYGTEVPPVHEIAILMEDTANIELAKERLKLISPLNTVSTWQELAPDAAMMDQFMIIYYLIFIGIVMFALAFGIINTMLMAILERTRELGMLMAIGMNRKKIFSMIMLETIFLTGVGAGAGMFAGWLIIKVLGNTGIHFASWGEGFEAIGYSATVYPVMTPSLFLVITGMVIITAIISSVWPARKALRLDPAEAIRKE